MILRFDNVQVSVSANPVEAIAWNRIRKANQPFVPSALYMHTYKLWRKTKGKHGWDGRVSILGKNSFSTGLLPFVLDELWKYKISPRLIDQRALPVRPSGYKPQISLRPYQLKAFNTCVNNEFNKVWWTRGILELCTGSGKTEIAVEMYSHFQVPTLFIVHTKVLLKQTIERFKKYGITAGQLGIGVNDPDPTGITVATIQTILSKLRRNESIDVLRRNVQQIFFDEAHLIGSNTDKGNQFVNVANLFNNAGLRWGLTATPFMRDTYSNKLLEGVTGKVLYKITNTELIKLGFLTPPKVKQLVIPKAPCPKSWPECYVDGVVLNPIRNDMIIGELKSTPMPCLVMCNRIAHAKILYRKATSEGISVEYVDGQTPVGTRKDYIKGLQDGTLNAIVCTTVFDEGVDIPELKSIILAGAGKSHIKQLQKLGRGLRIAHGKHEFILIDFLDQSTKLLERHSKARMKVWKDQGFTIV